jgi:hypothetical protein
MQGTDSAHIQMHAAASTQRSSCHGEHVCLCLKVQQAPEPLLSIMLPSPMHTNATCYLCDMPIWHLTAA